MILKTARQLANLRQGRNDWYKIENNSSDSSEVFIYDEIGYFGITAKDFLSDISGIKSDSIELHLNTPGGEVFDGIAIYNALKQHKATVTVIVDSLAASIGSVIAMAGDKIIMSKNSTMMIHEGHGLCVGSAADMKEMSQLLDKTSDNIASIYAERSGKPQSEWRKAMRNETWYSAEEAVKAGLADEVSGLPTNKQSATWDLSIYNYAGRDNSPAPNLDPPFDFAKAIKEAFNG